MPPMALFGRNKSTYDPCLGRTDLQAAHRALRKGDWGPAAAVLAHPGDRSVIFTGLLSEGVSTDVIRRWAETQPDSTTLALLATKLTSDAWDIRGGGMSETVADDAWPRFWEMLEHADDVVAQAISIGPPSADSWGAGIMIGVGRQLNIDLIQRRFEQCHQLQPFHANAVRAMLQARCDKWYGSHESMFQFARWVASQAPAGAPAQFAICEAHFERWRSMAATGVDQRTYFSQSNVRHEIATVADRFLQSTPSGPAPAEYLLALNWFVYAVGSANQRPPGMMAECVARIDRRPTQNPWRYMKGSIGAAYSDFSKSVLR